MTRDDEPTAGINDITITAIMTGEGRAMTSPNDMKTNIRDYGGGVRINGITITINCFSYG